MTTTEDLTTQALTREAIVARIQSECVSFNKSHQTQWRFECSLPPPQQNETAVDDSPPSNFFGIVAQTVESSSTTSYHSFATFFLAYSTWDGRVLFRDFEKSSPIITSDTETSLSMLWFQLLAKIAVRLGCNRLVWSQYNQVAVFPHVQPETLPSWLTLHWDLPEMQQFTAGKTVSSSLHDTGSDLRTKFVHALEEVQSPPQSNDTTVPFSLRLASQDDVPDITRLVRGLAKFENELDSVKVKPQESVVDGFGDLPLYYCVLLDCVDSNQKRRNACGMAFCYIGHTYETGGFLYLEDLFLEEAFRGKGGGTMIMGALAAASQSLGCSKMVWQALDCTYYYKYDDFVWNNPPRIEVEKYVIPLSWILCLSHLRLVVFLVSVFSS